MYGKINDLSNSANNFSENVRDIEWLVQSIEEHVGNAKGITEDAIHQLREIIGDNDPNEVEKISVEIEDLLMIMQSLDDIESELNEL